MSPIMVRPVREQLEHDRVIRLLQTRYRRRYDVGINPGAEQNAAVGATALYPDVVLTATDRGHKLQGVVEVETGESVNHLEALAQWKYLGALRAAFYLYVPAGSVDSARRLLEDNDIPYAEIWSYHAIGDQIRFNLVHRSRPAARSSAKRAAAPAKAQPARAAKARPAARAKSAGPAKAARATKRAPARPVKKKTAARKPARAQKRK
ncbi:MAG: hypothetical protein KGN76_04860 [Acidobacteriota bacterium]|nr:hypothetical protein [Acidobacteriota bacterium]